MGVVSEEAHIVKGKRTKRHRLQLPALTGSSSIGGDDTNQDNNVSSFQYSQFQSQSPTSSAEFSGSTTEEEEDMANCLILLAQGRGGVDQKLLEKGREGERFVGGGRRFVEAATTTNGKARFELYECKTCNRCFPSFQALGGHRASHKKPKTAAVEEENQSNFLSLDKPTPYSNQSTINKTRVHECSICGSEFSSGQALGGHMRRHRAVMAEPQENNKRQKVILSLDLNLPAPQEDDRDFPKSPSSFAFAGKQPLVFSTSPPLVDCHY